MIGIPGLSSVPTDNLYKFLAISGVVGYIAMEVLRSIGHDRQLDSFVAVTDAYTSANRFAADSMTALSAFLDSARKNPPRTRAGIDSVDVAVQKWNVLYARFNTLSAAADYLDKREESSRDRVRRENRRYFVIQLFFGVMAAFGFGAWYELVQKYQDAILRSEAQRVGFGKAARVKPKRIWRRRRP